MCYVEFLNELGDDKESSPSSNLFRFQNITENVIAAVENVFTFGTDQISKNFAWTCLVYEQRNESH